MDDRGAAGKAALDELRHERWWHAGGSKCSR